MRSWLVFLGQYFSWLCFCIFVSCGLYSAFLVVYILASIRRARACFWLTLFFNWRDDINRNDHTSLGQEVEVQVASMRGAVREVEAAGLEECLLQRLQGIILDLVEIRSCERCLQCKGMTVRGIRIWSICSHHVGGEFAFSATHIWKGLVGCYSFIIMNEVRIACSL